MAAMVTLGDHDLRFEEVVAVARGGAAAALTAAAAARLQASRDVVEALAAGDKPAYGISTGFGALARSHIPVEDRLRLQLGLIRSHAAGMGDPVPREVVRAMMLLRANTLAKGYSGVRPVVAQRLLDLLNADLAPYVPMYGSLGASGDLAPLAHAALLLVGEGWLLDPAGRPVDAARALRAAGIEPIVLQAKEGLALINGTDGMLGMLVLACVDAERLLKTADVVCALDIEAQRGTDAPFAADLHALRPHPGQGRSAANLTRLLANSPIIAERHAAADIVQDAYSLRCSPQVLGAARDTLGFAAEVARRELLAAVDNPVVLPDGRVESTGHFHGAPLGFAADFLAIALAEAGAIAERRIDRLMDPHRSRGLPPFLAPEFGVNSGLMIAQYTAAALVAENRRLAAPASVDSLPTSAMQEDHVSMGWLAALKLRRVVENLTRLLAIELVCAGHGIDLRTPPGPGAAGRAVVGLLREQVAGPGPDRFLAPDLNAAEALIGSGRVLQVAEAVVGALA